MDLQCNFLRLLEHNGFDKFENSSYDSQLSELTTKTVPAKAVASLLSRPLLHTSALIVLLYLTLHYYMYGKHINRWKKSNIPYLQPFLLIGHKYFLNITKKSYLALLNRIYEENPGKDAVAFFSGKTPTVLIRNPQLIQQIMVRQFDNAFRSGWSDSASPEAFQYMSDFLSDKGIWRSSRTKLAPAFSTSRVGGALFDRVQKQLDNLWGHVQEAQLSGRPVLANEIALNFAVDAGSILFYNQEINSYEQKSALHRLVNGVRKPSLPGYLRVFADSCGQLAWPLNVFKYVAEKDINEVHSILRSQHQPKTQQDMSEKKLMNHLTIDNNEESKNGMKKPAMDTDKLIGLVHNITALGLDSEYLLNIGILHLLSLHPEHQERIRAEIHEAMRKHNTSVLTTDVVQDLQFTEQCIYESARLLPSNVEFVRFCTEDFRVPGFDYNFKKGEKMIVCLYSVQRDPKYFKNPDTFDPDRFSPENKGSIGPETFLGFGLGPRKCLGYKVGVMMSATLIASILLKYNIKPHSHFKQMDVKDFYPNGLYNTARTEVLIDFVPVETEIQ